MAKRRKPHSRRARDHRLYGNSHVWTWESNGDVATAQTHSGFGWVDIGPDLAQHLLNLPRNWMIGVRALCRAGDGTEWMESGLFDLPSYSIQRIEGAYRNLRAQVLDAQRTDHVYDMGWIIRTWAGKKPDDPLERWHYHDAPADIIRQVERDERIVRRMAGAGYSPERFDRWQAYNRETDHG